MSAAAEGRTALVSAPSVDRSLGTMLLPSVLSLTAGSVDAIGFLGLGGLFIAHITGNLVILAAHIVADDEAPLAHMISFPVFIVALAVTRLLAAGLERMQSPRSGLCSFSSSCCLLVFSPFASVAVR